MLHSRLWLACRSTEARPKSRPNGPVAVLPWLRMLHGQQVVVLAGRDFLLGFRTFIVSLALSTKKTTKGNGAGRSTVIFMRCLLLSRQTVSQTAASERATARPQDRKTEDRKTEDRQTSPGRLLTLLLARAQSRSLPPVHHPHSLAASRQPFILSVCLPPASLPSDPDSTPSTKCRPILLLPDIPTTKPSRRPPSPRLPLRPRPPTPPSQRRQRQPHQ